MHILLTRPLEDCKEMIIKFKSLGHQVSHIPLLTVDKVDHEQINSLDFNFNNCPTSLPRFFAFSIFEDFFS